MNPDIGSRNRGDQVVSFELQLVPLNANLISGFPSFYWEIINKIEQIFVITDDEINSVNVFHYFQKKSVTLLGFYSCLLFTL